MKLPKVSVVMPVYNGEAYLRQAIDSILAQTFVDFELVLINDGSTDASVSIIESYGDPRVRLYNNAQNSGLAAIRNRGIREARGQYIAWLDCDDISLPTRLEKQVALLEKNPDVALCGTWVETMGAQKDGVWKYPVDSDTLRCRMLFDDPVATSSIMMRVACLEKQESYFDLDRPPAEDYDLWERISREWRVVNIEEVLTRYRVHQMQTSVVKVEQQKRSVWSIQNRMLGQLGITPTDDEMQLHLDVGAGWRFLPAMDRVTASESWLRKIEAANHVRRVFPKAALRRVLAERWRLVAGGAASNGLKAWVAYHRSDLSGFADRKVWRSARLLLKCLIHGR